MFPQGRMQDFGQGGQRTFDPRGEALSPIFGQNCLKKLQDFWKKSWGQGSPGAPLDPLVSIPYLNVRFLTCTTHNEYQPHLVPHIKGFCRVEHGE